MSATALKLLMAALMVLDHVHQFIPDTPMLLTYLGRLVAPVFYFLLAESYRYTRDRNRLIRRLFAAGLVMAAGSALLVRVLPGPLSIPNNILMNMAFSLVVIRCAEMLREHRQAQWKRSVGAGLLLFAAFIALFFTEGNYMTLLWLVLFIRFRERPLVRDAAFAAMAFLMLNMDFSAASVLERNYQWMMVFAIAFFRLYDGSRGAPLKWFFYVFYPLHIWILYAIGTQMR